MNCFLRLIDDSTKKFIAAHILLSQAYSQNKVERSPWLPDDRTPLPAKVYFYFFLKCFWNIINSSQFLASTTQMNLPCLLVFPTLSTIYSTILLHYLCILLGPYYRVGREHLKGALYLVIHPTTHPPIYSTTVLPPSEMAFFLLNCSASFCVETHQNLKHIISQTTKFQFINYGTEIIRFCNLNCQVMWYSCIIIEM